jgi:prepilin-type N-terminal cleavage/methylation domain-containing protein
MCNVTRGNRLPDQPRGLTLLEVVVATMVIAVALMSTMSVFINSERLNAVAREEAIAQAAINAKIAEMRNTKFGYLMNNQTQAANSTTPKGFSGGPDAVDSDRYLPGLFSVNVGGETLPEGVVSSPTYFQGSVAMGGRYYGPSEGAAEMRVIFINDEDPIEQELGEVNGNKDGLDLNRNGSVDTVPYDTTGWNTDTKTMPAAINAVFGPPDCTLGSTQLFPRKLGSGTATPIHDYINPALLNVMAVAVQVRWWSRAGVPREITVLTFITARSPSLSPPPPPSNFDGNL